MANFNRFPGSVAVVTGAASGIGRAAAERLADEGAIVYATDLRLDAVTDAHAGCDNLHPAAIDVSDSSAVDRLFERIAAEQGRVDAVVNSAGISDSPRRIKAGLGNDLENITDEDFRMVIDTNLTGTFFVTRAAVPLLKKTGHGGAIVNISSVGALANFPLEAAYPAAKAGVLGLTRATAALQHPTTSASTPSHPARPRPPCSRSIPNSESPWSTSRLSDGRPQPPRWQPPSSTSSVTKVHS